MVYVSFIVDVFAQRIVGWHAATNKRTNLVLVPLQIALWDRDRAGHPVQAGQLLHHARTRTSSIDNPTRTSASARA